MYFGVRLTRCHHASKELASNKTLNDEITCLLIQPRVANKRRNIQNKGRNHVTKIDMYIFLQHYALAFLTTKDLTKFEEIENITNIS